MNELLQQALALEENGLWQESIKIYHELLKANPDNPAALYYYAVCLFKQQIYDESLDVFVRCYQSGQTPEDVKREILEHLLTAYYQPNADWFRSNYQKNVACFSSYEHNYVRNFPEFNDLPFLCIPRNDREWYIFDKRTRCFSKEKLTLVDEKEYRSDISPDNVVLFINIFDATILNIIEAATTNPRWINGMKQPMYLLWVDHFQMQIYLQIQDYQSLVDKNRIVIFPDLGDDLQHYFIDHQSVLPEMISGDGRYMERIMATLSEIVAARKRDLDEKTAVVQQLVGTYDRGYYERLFAGELSNIRILFYTSRFTRVVQYSTRDLMKACQDRGITCELLIEKSDLHRAGNADLIDKIAQFQPNVVFRINFFKSDFTVIPENMLFITWMQDPGGQIYSTNWAQRFSWNDFSLALPAWLKIMEKTGFDAARLSPQSVPINDAVFYPRQLSADEKVLYSSDVALPSNYNMPEDVLNNLISDYYAKELDESNRARFAHLMTQTYDAICSKIEGGMLFVSKEQCANLLHDTNSTLGASIDDTFLNEIAETFFLRICYGIHRRTTLKWVLDGGFQLKLWGRDWEKDVLLKDYAHGVLEHGESLAKMYSATKIVLATFSHYTGHFRVLESLACGALPMMRYVPEEFDLEGIRGEFKEDEHFVFYHDKQELIDKINYYLVHENERQKIVQNGRKVALESKTYSSAVQNMLGLVKRNLAK